MKNTTQKPSTLKATTPSAATELQGFLTRPRRSRDERKASGKALRREVPRESHAAPPRADRRDPVALLRAQESTREPSLLPLRYERMSAEPFAFLRGSAAVMAADLATLPHTTIDVQLCGDAHLANFGMFASPDRRLVFDLNDFDETLPGPFEWDVKRLAASVAVAGRVNHLKDSQLRRAAAAAVASYRTTVRQLAGAATLDAWYARLDVESLVRRLRKTKLGEQAKRAAGKAWRNTGDVAVAKLTAVGPDGRRFRTQPPLLVPVAEAECAAPMGRLGALFVRYLASLPEDRAALLRRYSLVDLAHKVVGVGSVGTRAMVVLLEAGDHEPLILQIKQAERSALEPYLRRSRLGHAGRRVVTGQHLLQATGDPFLGWTEGDESSTEYYIRQLRDMKGSIETGALDADQLTDYGRLVGAVLGRAHARAGDASALSGYLGGAPVFDEAVAEFAMSYADITEADHAALVRAVRQGSVAKTDYGDTKVRRAG